MRKNSFLMMIPFAPPLPIIQGCCNDRLNPPNLGVPSQGCDRLRCFSSAYQSMNGMHSWSPSVVAPVLQPGNGDGEDRGGREAKHAGGGHPGPERGHGGHG